jgi:hypothetical protein
MPETEIMAPNGETPAKETVCDEYKGEGEVYGLCISYEAKNCDETASDDPSCAELKEKLCQSLTFPCGSAPSMKPSSQPSSLPSSAPSSQFSSQSQPSDSAQPSMQPSSTPSSQPSSQPSDSKQPQCSQVQLLHHNPHPQLHQLLWICLNMWVLVDVKHHQAWIMIQFDSITLVKTS